MGGHRYAGSFCASKLVWFYEGRLAHDGRPAREGRLARRRSSKRGGGVSDLLTLIVDSEVRGTTLKKLSSIARYEVRLHKS